MSLLSRIAAPRDGISRIRTSPRLMLVGAGTLSYTIGGWIGVLAGDSLTGAGVVTILLCFVAGTTLCVLALRPRIPQIFSRHVAIVNDGWLALLGALLLSAIVTVFLAVGLLGNAWHGSIRYDSDAAAFNHFNAELALKGVNPYTADGFFWDAIRQFPASGATPLRRGRYSDSALGPSLRQIVRDVRSELAYPVTRGPEFSPSSLHSYPALSFLVYAPGVWAGLPSTAFTSCVIWVLFLLACGWGALSGMRVTVLTILLANSLLAFWTLLGSFEIVALLPVVLAWRLLDRRWLSPVLLGLGCAVKQIVWPLVPFYAILVWRRDGWRAAMSRTATVVGTFALVNLPYIVRNPNAWLSSQFLPVTLPIFPSGIGLVALGRAGILPLWAPIVYTVLEVLALVALLVWYARAGWQLSPAIALVVGLLPIALSWHSLLSYFIAIPCLALAGVLSLPASSWPVKPGEAYASPSEFSPIRAPGA